MAPPNHEIIAELEYDKILPFLRPQLRPNLVWGFSYWAINFIAIAFLVYFTWTHPVSLDTFLTRVGIGFWLFFVLLPVHEIIHAGVYKLMGAPKVSFGSNWKKFVFFAVADQFIVDRKTFLWVALAPFLVINSGLIILCCSLSFTAQLTLLGALILHTAGCSGDFALVSFMHQHRDSHIATMDDVKAGKAYFFAVKVE